MAQAIKCDRCGKYYDKPNNANRLISGCIVRGIRLFTSGPYREFDLCGDCVEDLFKFLHLDKETNENG